MHEVMLWLYISTYLHIHTLYMRILLKFMGNGNKRCLFCYKSFFKSMHNFFKTIWIVLAYVYVYIYIYKMHICYFAHIKLYTSYLILNISYCDLFSFLLNVFEMCPPEYIYIGYTPFHYYVKSIVWIVLYIHFLADEGLECSYFHLLIVAAKGDVINTLVHSSLCVCGQVSAE